MGMGPNADSDGHGVAKASVTHAVPNTVRRTAEKAGPHERIPAYKCGHALANVSVTQAVPNTLRRSAKEEMRGVIETC